MRILVIAAVLVTFGCSPGEPSKTAGNAREPGRSSVTLDNLVYVDVSSPDASQHPLVCGAGRDFSAGCELAFRHASSGESVHAVFPAEVTPPKTLDGTLILRGHFQGIRNREHYKLKKPEEDYQYFVVTSWEHKK